jgi:AcrR family transcriptional regulator
MRPRSIVDGPPNGRERLLAAAVRLFGRDGFDATSVRAVAEEADVSWGLVRFYFQSKDGLRDAAEHHVMAVYMRAVAVANSVKSHEELDLVIRTQSQDLPDIARFLRRAIMEERPIALEFLRALMAVTETRVAEQQAEFPDDPNLFDPVDGVIHRLGYLLLAPQIETLLGRNLFSTEELQERNWRQAQMAELVRLGRESRRQNESG